MFVRSRGGGCRCADIGNNQPHGACKHVLHRYWEVLGARACRAGCTPPERLESACCRTSGFITAACILMLVWQNIQDSRLPTWGSRSPGHQGSCVGLAGRVAAGTIARGCAARPAAGPVASGGATAAAGAVDIGVAGTRALIGHDGAAAAAVVGGQDLGSCCRVAPTAKETTTRCELACLLGIVQLIPDILKN
jgi:hypothetical protein